MAVGTWRMSLHFWASALGGGAFPVSSSVSSVSYTTFSCIFFGDIFLFFCAAGAFQTYLTAVMALQYSEQPDYSALKAELSDALVQLGASVEEPLDF